MMGFSKTEIKTNLLATLEMALLMPQGPARFTNDISAMFRSFWLMIVVMPFTYYAISLLQPATPQIAELSYILVAFMFTMKILVATVLTLLLSYGFAKQYERMDHFCTAITALNWSGLINTLLFLPAVLMVGSGAYIWDDIYGYLVFLMLYGYVITGFILTYTMRIPWELGGFLAVCFMAINQTSIDLMYWIASHL